MKLGVQNPSQAITRDQKTEEPYHKDENVNPVPSISYKENMSSYIHIGKMDKICCPCGAKLYHFEYNEKLKSREICCNHGKVKLPWIELPPLYLKHCLFSQELRKRKGFDRVFVLTTVHCKKLL